MKPLYMLATTAALLVMLGCPGRQQRPDASRADAPVADGAMRDGGVDGGADSGADGGADGGEDGGDVDAATVDALDERCPSHLDQLTLRVAKQTRLAGLIGEPVQSVSSAAPATVAVELYDQHALLRALAPGSAQVSLVGAVTNATLEVGVDLSDDHFVTAVVDTQYGAGAGFGQASMPDVVLGPPAGRGAGAGSLDVVSLGLGGSITVELGVDVVDGPGVDLLVFENPFVGFYESAEVAVSLDGVDFATFPCTPVAPYPGCAGVNPVQAHVDNEIDPTDPQSAGGDAFDLGQLGVARARFVRITDVGGLDTGGGMAGFDLDAVVAIHALPRGGATLTGPARVTLAPGELVEPRFDVALGARALLGVATRCEVAPDGVVELGCGCALRGLSAGAATLSARLGDLQTTVPIEVGP
jgi:hypothetical protein